MMDTTLSRRDDLNEIISVTPPRNLAQVYHLSKAKMNEIKTSLERLDVKYGFKKSDTSNPYLYNDFYQRYASHLNRIRAMTGVDAINQTEKIKHLITIVENNLKFERLQNIKRQQEHAIRVRQLAEENENKKAVEQPAAIATETDVPREATSSSLNEVVVEDPSLMNAVFEGVERESSKDIINLKLYYKRSDSIITPLIKDLNQPSLKVAPETKQDLEVLIELFELSLDSFEKYSKLIDNTEKVCTVHEMYLKSFFNRDHIYEFLLKMYDFKRSNFETDSDFGEELTDRMMINTQVMAGRKDDKDIDYEKKLMSLLDTPIKYDEQRNYVIAKVKTAVKRLRRILKYYTDESYFGDDSEKEPTEANEEADENASEEELERQFYLDYKKILAKKRGFSGIPLKEFSEEIKKLANRFECEDLQLILIIPEMSVELNKCITLLNDWLQLDKTYVEYVLNDLEQIDKQRKEHIANRHFSERLFNQLNHRIQLLVNDLEAKQKDLLSMLVKPGKTTFDESEHFNSNRHNVVTLIEYNSALDSKKMLDQIEKELKNCELESARINRMLSSSKKQKEERYRHADAMLKRLGHLSGVIAEFHQSKKVKQSDLDVLEFAYTQLKEIVIYKQCSENLEKIFYDIELPRVKISTSSQIQYSSLPTETFSPAENKFSICFHVLANMLGADWTEFYYELPFYPKRGQEIIKKDIDQILFKHDRGDTHKERAMTALTKWRREHQRAKIEDLQQALKKIGRLDILQLVNKKLDENNSKMKNKLDPSELANKKKLLEKKLKEKTTASNNAASAEQEDNLDDAELRVREAELLHHKLNRLFDRLNRENAAKSQEIQRRINSEVDRIKRDQEREIMRLFSK